MHPNHTVYYVIIGVVATLVTATVLWICSLIRWPNLKRRSSSSSMHVPLTNAGFLFGSLGFLIGLLVGLAMR